MTSDCRPADERPASVVFTTEGLRPQDRIEAWNAAFGSLNEIAILADKGLTPSVRTENWMLDGGIVLSETRVQGGRFVRDGNRARRDQLDHWVLRVIRRGTGRLSHSRFVTTTGPGDIVLFPASDTWTCEWADVEWVTICIPRDLDPRLTAGLSFLPPGRLCVGGTGLLADLMLALPTRVATADAHEVASLTGMILAALGACLPNSPETDLETDTSLVAAKERIRRAILQNIASSTLTPSSLASLAGFSRSSLYRILEKEGGVSRFIRSTRLSLAYEALRSMDCMHKSIACIAEEHGFPDPPEFSRAFRTAFGRTPREARAEALAGPQPLLARPPAEAWSADAIDLARQIYLPSAPKLVDIRPLGPVRSAGLPHASVERRRLR
jgi:AraC-like DNA-binding protein